MSQSGLGKPDPDLKGVELLFHQKGGSASFGAKMALSLNGVDPGSMNPIALSTCRARCSKILHDIIIFLLGDGFRSSRSEALQDHGQATRNEERGDGGVVRRTH
jgi:hypothetical protein